MNHAEARKLLELAAVEPRGLDRLMAGDTPEAAALASHLAGCPDCTAEMARIRHAVGLIRGVIRSTPPPELRERTLAFVAAVGRERSSAGRSAWLESPTPIAPTPWRPTPWTMRASAWVATVAAAIVLSVAAAGAFLTSGLDSRLAERDALIARQGNAIEGLSRVSTWSLRVSAESDAEHVALASAAGDGVSGTVLYSPHSRELVVVATGLAEPAAGREFRCWVEIDGRRLKIGKMFFGGELAYWAGDVPKIDATVRATFGVSLTDATSPDDLGGDPVISGEL